MQLGIGFLGVALAFGLTVVTMAYAVGHISGAHFNPAVTIGVAVARRFEWKDVPAYVVTQVVAGFVAGLALWGIANGQPGFDATGNMAANGYGEHSPGKYGLLAVFIAEVLLTAVFLYVILGATDTRAPRGLRAHRDRPGAHPHPPHLHPDLQHLGQPGPLHRRRVLQRQRRGRPAVGVLAGARSSAPPIAGATFHLITGVDRRDRDISGEVDPDDLADGLDPDASRGV